ncbi:MAG: hypothetical protein QM664_02425 [Flavihumibacter sp.]
MCLNSIKLQPQQVAELYRRSLVTCPAPEANPEAAPPFADEAAENPPSSILPFLGENKKHITILVHYPQHTYLPDEAFGFLGNILTACQLSAKDAAIINMAKQPAAYADLLNQLRPRHLICFGPGARPDNWPAPPRVPPTPHQQLSLLEAPPLDTLNQNSATAKTLKKQLWEALKKMLGV